MKAATGELNLTVITIIAIAAVIGFFTYSLWPRIQGTIDKQWNTVTEGGSGKDQYSQQQQTNPE